MPSCHLSLVLIAATSLLARTPTTAFCQAPAEPLRFYVATDGNDQWSGKAPLANAEGTDGPFASCKGACNAIRRLRTGQGGSLGRPVAVLIRGGEYQVAEPLLFTGEDSGSAECPIIFEAYENERPRI